MRQGRRGRDGLNHSDDDGDGAAYGGRPDNIVGDARG